MRAELTPLSHLGHLPTSPCISLYLPKVCRMRAELTSAISLHLPTSPYTSLHLPMQQGHDRTLDAAPLVVCVCATFLSAAEMVGVVGVGECSSYVRVSLYLCTFWVISYEQRNNTKGTLSVLLPLSLFMLAVLLASLRQLPALACTKLRSKAPGRSHQCACQLRWETR